MVLHYLETLPSGALLRTIKGRPGLRDREFMEFVSYLTDGRALTEDICREKKCVNAEQEVGTESLPPSSWLLVLYVYLTIQ